MFSRIELTRTPCAALSALLLLAWLPLLTGLVAAALLVTPVFWAAFAVAAVLLVQRCRDQALMRTGRTIRKLVWQPGGLTVEQRDGTAWKARVADSSRLFSGGVLLKLRPVATTSFLDHFRFHTVWLVHTGRIRNIDSTALRRLRVVLRLTPPGHNLSNHIPPDEMEGRPT